MKRCGCLLAAILMSAGCVSPATAADEPRSPALTIPRNRMVHEWLRSAAFSPDGKRQASGGGREIKLWDAGSGEEKGSLAPGQVVRAVTYSPDGKLLATGNAGQVTLWDATALESRKTFRASSEVPAFTPSGRQLLSADNDVRLFDLEVLLRR